MLKILGCIDEKIKMAIYWRVGELDGWGIGTGGKFFNKCLFYAFQPLD